MTTLVVNNQTVAEQALRVDRIVTNLTTGVSSVRRKLNKAGRLALTPVQLLRGYYAKVLERDVTIRQTLMLTCTQLSFFAAFLPDAAPMMYRVGAIALCFGLGMQCRKEMCSE